MGEHASMFESSPKRSGTTQALTPVFVFVVCICTAFGSGDARAAGFEEARAAYLSKSPDAESLLREAAQGATTSPADRRDAFHLLGQMYLVSQRHEAALDAFREAIALARTPEGSSALLDLLAHGAAEAIAGMKTRSPELEAAFDEYVDLVMNHPYTGLRGETGLLRARVLESRGDLTAAVAAYEALLDRFPEATFVPEVRRRLAGLRVSSPRSADAPELASLAEGVSAPGRVPLSEIRHLLTERRFDLADRALAPWLEEPERKDESAYSAYLSALELELENDWENFRFAEVLATSDKLKRSGKTGLSKAREQRLHALSGDFEKAVDTLKKRHRGGRGKAYFAELGDLAFEFARYDVAYEAYLKANGKNARTERMIWSLLRTGRHNEAARHWEKAGRTRGTGRNLFERYWYARARQMAGRLDEARRIFNGLVEDAALGYYGLQAASRLQELRNDIPMGTPPPVPTVPRRRDEPEVGTPTVTWSEASLSAAFDRAPRPAPFADLHAASLRLAERWGEVAEETRRAAELIGLGDLASATLELRVVDMDLRSLKSSAGLQTRARSDLLDNRSVPRARGGESMRAERPRKTAEQAQSFKRQAEALRRELREVQVALADPYAVRRAALERQWNVSAERLATDGQALYPIAYPEVVEPLSKQLGLPPYFIYAIMTVESAFHPGAVSVANAFGLVQVIPRTGENLARELGFVDFMPERLLEPSVSIYFGGYYLARLLARFHGQEPLAAAAYNAGPHRVATWLLARGKIPLDMFIEDIPYDQARNYTKRVFEHIGAYRRVYHAEEGYYIRNVIDTTMGDSPNY
jgi:soluble lytic murein transglycosylase-like protein